MNNNRSLLPRKWTLNREVGMPIGGVTVIVIEGREARQKPEDQLTHGTEKLAKLITATDIFNQKGYRPK